MLSIQLHNVVLLALYTGVLAVQRSVQKLSTIEATHTFHDANCTFRAFVRAPDLSPSSSLSGQVRIMQNGTLCALSDIKLELRLDESFQAAWATEDLVEDDFQRIRIKQDRSRSLSDITQYETEILRLGDKAFDVQYIDSSNYTFTGETSNVFAVSTGLRKTAKKDTIQNFYIHVPGTRFPAVLSRGPFMGRGYGSSDTVKWGYTNTDLRYIYVVHGRVGTEPMSIMAGHTSFHPQSNKISSPNIHLSKPQSVSCSRYVFRRDSYDYSKALAFTSNHESSKRTFTGNQCYSNSSFFSKQEITGIQSINHLPGDSDILHRGQKFALTISLVDQDMQFLQGPFCIDANIGSRKSLVKGIAPTPRYINRTSPHDLSWETLEELDSHKEFLKYHPQTGSMSSFIGSSGQQCIAGGEVAKDITLELEVSDTAFLSMTSAYEEITHVISLNVYDLARPRNTGSEIEQWTEHVRDLPSDDNSLNDGSSDEEIHLSWEVPVRIIARSPSLSKPLSDYRDLGSLEPQLSTRPQGAASFKEVTIVKRALRVEDLCMGGLKRYGKYNLHGMIPVLKQPKSHDYVGLAYEKQKNKAKKEKNTLLSWVKKMVHFDL